MKKSVFKIMAIVLVCILALSSCSRKNLQYGIEFYGGDPAYQGVRDITIWAGKHVVIPSEYNGLPVKSLDDDNWLKLPSIYETLILPETIEQIDRDFYDKASRHLKYNEYDNAYYLGTKDNPYFALVKVKTADTPTVSAMSYVIDDVDSVNKETPATPPFKPDRSDITSCVIHPDTRVIAGNAFEGCTYLKSITIPGSIKMVPEFAFAGCTSLESVVLEEGVEEISWSAFFECYALKSISLPSTLTEVYGFSRLIGLESIVIPEGVTKINDYAFAGCENLKQVTLPSSIVYIGDGAFDGCRSLESIDIPNSIDYLGDYAFRDNESLTDIKIPIGLFEKGGQNAFLGTNITNFEVDYSNIECVEIEGNLYDKDLTTLIKYCGDPSVKCFLVPQYVKKIAEFAFKDSSLEEIVFPKNLTYVGMGAFYNCDGLKYIDLSVTAMHYIGDYAFTDCDNLLTCQLRSFNEYEYSAIFDSCDSLQTVRIYGRFHDLSVSMFDECPALENIFIVDEDDYDSINGIIYKNDELLFYPHGKRDQTFTVPDFVDCIAENAFKNHKYLEKVIISGPRCYIDDGAFEGCQALQEIEIVGNSSLYIGDRAFKDCISLKEIILNDRISHIGESAFEGCSSLERAVLGNGLNNIYANTFRNCSSLKSVDLGDPKLLFIMEGAFIGCFELESIVIPNYCLNIKGKVFEEQVQIYYNGTVQECGWESYGWSMMKRNCEDGFFIICTDGNFYMKK